MFYYTVNVPYPVGVRFSMGDFRGKVLTIRDPYVAIEDKDLRDFRRANKYVIVNGLIVETAEPSMDFESPNMVDDEKATELVKNLFVLKKALLEITSPSVVRKLLTEAELQKRPSNTLKAIKNRLLEIDDTIEDVSMMGGVE